MHRFAVLLCSFLAVGLFTLHVAPAHASQQQLQGMWTAEKAEQDGKPADDLVGHRLTFAGNKFDIRSKEGKSIFAGTIKVDAAARPAVLDFTHAKGALKGKTWKGIYSLDGDTLAICDNAPDLTKPRPAAFEAKQASGYVLVTFRRAKH